MLPVIRGMSIDSVSSVRNAPKCFEHIGACFEAAMSATKCEASGRNEGREDRCVRRRLAEFAASERAREEELDARGSMRARYQAISTGTDLPAGSVTINGWQSRPRAAAFTSRNVCPPPASSRSPSLILTRTRSLPG